MIFFLSLTTCLSGSLVFVAALRLQMGGMQQMDLLFPDSLMFQQKSRTSVGNKYDEQ